MKLKPYHPLSQGLAMSFLFNENGGNIVYDATGNQNHGAGTNIAWGRDGLDLPGVNERITIPNFIGQDDDWTIFTSFIQDTRNPDSQTKDSILVTMLSGTGTGRSILYIDDQITGPTYKLRSFIDGFGRAANTVIEPGISYTAGFTQNGTSFHFYLNGKDDGSFTGTASPANGDIILFDHATVNEGCFDGTIGVFHWYNRPLSAEEMMWLDYDPFGMFEPDFMPHYYPSATFGYTLIAAPGQYELTGQDIDLDKSSQIIVGSGTYAVTGNESNLLKGYLLNSESGLFTISGQIIDLNKSSKIIVGSGTYDISGQDVTLIYTPTPVGYHGELHAVTQFDGDVAYVLTFDGGQITYIGGQPVMDVGGLENAVNISLFTDLEWWANSLNENEPDKQVGSDFEERTKPKAINTAYLRDVEDAARDALRWMINQKIAQTVEAKATWPELNMVGLEILITKPDGDVVIFRHELNWESGLFYPVTAKIEDF